MEIASELRSRELILNLIKNHADPMVENVHTDEQYPLDGIQILKVTVEDMITGEFVTMKMTPEFITESSKNLKIDILREGLFRAISYLSSICVSNR